MLSVFGEYNQFALYIYIYILPNNWSWEVLFITPLCIFGSHYFQPPRKINKLYECNRIDSLGVTSDKDILLVYQKTEQCPIYVWQQVGSYTNEPVDYPDQILAGNSINLNHYDGQILLGGETPPQLIVLEVLATYPMDAILSSTPKQSHTITTITPKYDTPRMVQEMNLSDVSYCQNNWEKTP